MRGDGGFFEQIIESVGVGIAVYGADGAFEYVNDAYADLLETDREALRGVAIWEVNPEFERDRFDDYWRSFDTGETRAVTTRHEFGDTSVPVNIVTTCREIDGARYHFGTIRDVTDLRAQRAEIEYQRSLLKAQQEAAIDGMLVVDEDARIVSYNDRFKELWEIPKALLESGDDEPVLDYVVNEVARPEAFRERVEYLYDNPRETAHDEIELADGRVFDRYSAPITDGETYYGRLWTFRDVTDRVERERELGRQNERLERYADVVSHDLRNPLNVAVANLECAATECDSERIDDARDALDRMETLIEDTLALARAGRSIGDVEPVPLGAAARQAWTNVETSTADLHVRADVSVRADENRLVQLFENLFRNAIEHGSAASNGGTRRDVVDDGSTASRGHSDAVEHGTASPHPDVRGGSDAVEPAVTITVGTLPDGFYVEDDGPGIPEGERGAVFEAGNSGTESGTGFGLSIVQEIADAHGWAIDVTDGTGGADESGGREARKRDRSGGARFEITDVDVVP